MRWTLDGSVYSSNSNDLSRKQVLYLVEIFGIGIVIGIVIGISRNIWDWDCDWDWD